MTQILSLHTGYNAPYLSVYSENAVDVFDVNTMEWIQTIPLKKVSDSTDSSSKSHTSRPLWLHLVDQINESWD